MKGREQDIKFFLDNNNLDPDPAFFEIMDPDPNQNLDPQSWVYIYLNDVISHFINRYEKVAIIWGTFCLIFQTALLDQQLNIDFGKIDGFAENSVLFVL